MSQRVKAVEYIRGIAMLGVLGIHTGAYSLSNPTINKHLFILLEILSRFSVPIFFFVSAFGLFMSEKKTAQDSYWTFIRRRLQTVLVPYLVWSFLYMLHETWQTGQADIWRSPLIYKYLMFGLASYQLYFLVILIWFYALMPVWRKLLQCVLLQPIRNLLLLLSLQIIINYSSSYLLQPVFENHYINTAIEYRFSFWVIHYVFIFLLGGVCATRWNIFNSLMEKNKRLISLFFLLTVLGMMYYYYGLLASGFTLEETVNTIHQLSPIGVLYTFAATLFSYRLLHTLPPQSLFHSLLNSLAKFSYPIYLVHPFVMEYLAIFLNTHNIVMTESVTILFYTLSLAISFSVAWAIQQAGRRLPLVTLLLTGSVPANRP